MNTEIVICNVQVAVDEQGRYNMNDLHKASGGHSNKQPWKFFRTDTAQGMIEILKADGGEPVQVQGKGRFATTNAVKELVYAYAMWLNPEFNLHVIRTFDKVVQAELAFERKERALLSGQFSRLAEARGWDSVAAAKVYAQSENLATAAENKAREAVRDAIQLRNTLKYIKKAAKKNQDITGILNWQKAQDELPINDRTLHYE